MQSVRRRYSFLKKYCYSTESKDVILNVFKIGCDVFEKFCLERFSKKSVSLSKPIHRVNFPTFTSVIKTTQETAKKTKKETKSIQRIIGLANERNYSIDRLLTFELTHNNYLFQSGDILKKENNKSQLLKELKNCVKIKDYSNFPEIRNFCLIVDVMIVCRKLQLKSLKTFKDFAIAFCNVIKNNFNSYVITRIDFVFDSYFEFSPKSVERQKRYGTDSINLHIINDEIKIPIQQDKFWASQSNKVLLQKYLSKYILLHANDIWPGIEIICSFHSSSLSLSFFSLSFEFIPSSLREN